MKRSALVWSLAIGSLMFVGCSAADTSEQPYADGTAESESASRGPIDAEGKADGVATASQRNDCFTCIKGGGGAACGPRCAGISNACTDAVAGGCAAGMSTSVQSCLDTCNPCNGACGSGSYNSGAYNACTCGQSDPCGWSNDGYCDARCATDYGTTFDDSGDCGDTSNPPAPESSGSSGPLDCGADCGNGSYTSGAYTACSCDPSDPCGWSNDGFCDSKCLTDFATTFDDSQDCGGTSGGGSSGGDTYDASLGNQLAAAAKSGSAGYSMGACYEYVWRALRSVIGYQIESLPIPPTSAYQFGEWVIANPNTARAELHLARTSTPASSAPRGSVIVWPRGVCGYSSAHGHIEIAQGDGTACSDFCGGIAGCTAQVFMPVK